MTGVSNSQVSRLCGEIDERVDAFLNRPLEGEWPYLWLDATEIKVRRGGRIVSVAAIVAVAVNLDGRLEVLGLAVQPSEAEVFWGGYLQSSGSQIINIFKHRNLIGMPSQRNMLHIHFNYSGKRPIF